MFILYVLTGQFVESTEKNLTSPFCKEKAGFSWNFPAQRVSKGGNGGGGASRELSRNWYNRHSYRLTDSEGGFLSKLRLDRSRPWFTVMETDRVHLEFYHVRSNTLFGSEGLYVPLTRNSRTN